ncbi:hypothetical protein GCM10028802_28120 [Terrabacter terrigena]
MDDKNHAVLPVRRPEEPVEHSTLPLPSHQVQMGTNVVRCFSQHAPTVALWRDRPQDYGDPGFEPAPPERRIASTAWRARRTHEGGP